MNKKGFVGMLIMFILGILVIGVEVKGIHYVTLENGTHTGIITSVETSGIIFKTTTVYFKTDGQSSQEDEYCLIDKDLIPLLKEKELSKESITIEYKDYLVKGYRYCNNEQGGIITGIK